jgi:hypothetical protein
MAAYFYSVARVKTSETTGEFGWQVMRHDGREIVPASDIFLVSAEARAEAERLAGEQGATDA